MRKVQKQEITALLQTLQEAHNEIKNNIDQRNYILAQELLGQCQEGAISIGTAIEEFEGEGFVTVGYIEAYCDIVFRCHEELNDSDINGNKIYKNLRKHLLRIENSVKNDIPIRKEVAFFPYKASMWDALESVYLAAKEDPNCDVYCVPIPYYDRNSDGSFGQMHYEGTQYPENIEVIDWQTYKFEQRQPDVIFTHNPYDDWNLVTCVHPRYFSNNLKKYTEKLVYIPYFVLDEIEPDDQARIDAMKHFIWIPGVINADKVIVQSEKMKQIYVNEYIKAAQAKGLQGKHLDRKYLEEKFLGFGSPKFDKVQNTNREDLEIPEDWRKIIQKADGSWKKIIFYNTGIAALLENNEKMLKKMKDVFRIFKENKDEVALLWRPHPLIKSTISSMRPQLWLEYEKIVNQYKEEGWGIYDDTSDMDRAVVFSDAYYGDYSSVIPVYKQTGKKVYLQYVRLQNDLKFEKKTGKILTRFIPSIGVTTKYKDKLYFLSSDYNGLFSIDLKDGRTNLIGTMKDEIKDLMFPGTSIVHDKYIIICPNFFSKIHIWDIENEREIQITNNLKSKGKPAYFSGMIDFDNKMFFAPSLADKGLIFDFDTNSISEIIDLKNEYQKKCCKEYNQFTIDRGYKYQNNIYWSVTDTNFICDYSIQDNNISFIKVDVTDSFWLAVGYNEKLYIIGKKGMIYVWSIETKKVVSQCPLNLGKERDITYIQDKAILGNDIYFMSPIDTWCIKYSIINNHAIISDYKELFKLSMKENEYYYFSSQDEDGIIYLISNENNLAIIDAVQNQTLILPLKFDFEQLEQFWRDENQSANSYKNIGKTIMKYLE